MVSRVQEKEKRSGRGRWESDARDNQERDGDERLGSELEAQGELRESVHTRFDTTYFLGILLTLQTIVALASDTKPAGKGPGLCGCVKSSV